MSEVSSLSVALVLDGLEQHAVDLPWLHDGLPRSPEEHRRDGMTWEQWVGWLERIGAAIPVPMEELFVPGAAKRVGHPFSRIVRELPTIPDLYALVARWGLARAFTVVRGSFAVIAPQRGLFTVTIDESRVGSTETPRFLVGMLRATPQLQGYPEPVVTMRSLTPHRAEMEIELPVERSLLARGRRLLGAALGTRATLDELAAQGDELAAKHAELEQQLAATQEQQRWLDGALNAGKIGLWRWDPLGKRVRISPTLAVWLGVPDVSEIEPDVWQRAVHPDDQEDVKRVFTEAFANRKPFEAEFRIPRTNGDDGWYQLKGRIETASDGRFYAYGSTVDISEERRLENRLRMADRLIAAGTLAAGIAHEINNPLTYVMGSVDLIQRRLAALPEARAATKDLLAQVLDGVERIRAVVADVHMFARRDDNDTAPVDLNSVCAGAIRIVSADVRHRAMLETELSPETPAVLANDARLGQVVINLIVNAGQAMPLGRSAAENRVVVRTGRAATGEAVLEVEDNGVGIPAGVLPRVFDPFFTTKPVGVGTGLGLSVCQGIVSSLGGRIEVTSTPGRGSRFTVTLRPAQLVATAPRVRSETPERAGRVLVIDDEPLIRSVVARTLMASGFEVDEAQNGRDGLARASGDRRYDAIVCDVMMPDFDGVALHSTLAKTHPDVASRMVFISGGAVTERTQQFLQTPGLVVLHKPFAFDHLLEAIERAAHGTRTSLPFT